MKKLIDLNLRSDKMANCLFEPYTNSVMTHWRHIYATFSPLYMATICAYPPYQHAFPNWKWAVSCCENYPYIDLP